MTRGVRAVSLLVLIVGTCLAASCSSGGGRDEEVPAPSGSPSALPAPRTDGPMSVEEALARRRSVREYSPKPLALAEVGQLLWAAQGVTATWGGRTAPSAGALYPLDVLLVAGAVEGLAPGVYRYDPAAHALSLVRAGDVRAQLSSAALGQEPVRAAAASLVITGVYARTTRKYGDVGERFVHMEAGHAAQNVYLQATALGLGTVSMGALREGEVRELLQLPQGSTPLYVLPVGRPT